MWTVTLALAVAGAACASAYQPYQYGGLQHRRTSLNDQAALNYQKQILQWQQAVAQRAPQAVYNNPWISRGNGDFRQDAAAPTVPETLPPQPTIVAPLPPVQQETSPTFPPTYPPVPPPDEVNNQLIGETTPPPNQNPLKALCKAPRGQFPGTSCGKFVNCWDDFVVEQECPQGLYFNEANSFCDYPFNVACLEQPTQQPGGTQVPGGVGGGTGQGSEADLGNPGARCPTEFGTYRSTKNCGVFYMCVGYLPFEFTCPAGLNFHKDLQVCDYPYRVECNGVPSNQPPPESTAVPETTYVPDSPPGPPAEPAPELPSPTPVDTIPSQPVAVSPEPTPAAPPPAVPGGPEAFYSLKKIPASVVDPGVPCRPNTVYRLSPSCSSVAVCRNGFTQVLNCGPGTAFDVYSDRCVSFTRARC